MVKRKQNGQFAKGSKPVAGFKKGKNVGEKHPMWKGGLPKCHCGKQLSRREYNTCRKHQFTDGVRKKMSNARKNIYKDSKHPQWQGEKAGYRAKHLWIERKLGKPQKCDHCGQDNLSGHKIHWANISHNYKRIISDWLRLCSKCHGKFDIENNR